MEDADKEIDIDYVLTVIARNIDVVFALKLQLVKIESELSKAERILGKLYQKLED